MRALSLAQQGAESIDDRAGSLVVLDDVVECAAQLVDIQRRSIEKVARRLCVGEDGRQRLAQLVGERAGQLAKRRHPAEMCQLASLRIGFQFGEFPLGDVPHDAENPVTVTADDARLEETVVAIDAERVFDFFWFVRQARALKRLRE